MEEPEGQEGGFPYSPTQQPPEDHPPQDSPPQDSGSQEEGENKNTGKIIYAVIGILLLVIVYFVFFSSGGNDILEGEYGDGKCAIEENCFDHPDDCKCSAGMVCSPGKKKCVPEETEPLSAEELANITSGRKKDDAQSLLGNGKCDLPFENCFDTIKECPCASGEYCSDKKECVKPKCGNKMCELIGNESPETCCFDCKCTLIGEFCSNQTLACENATMSLTEERAKELSRIYFEGKGFTVASLEAIGVIEYNGNLTQRIKAQISGEDFSRYLSITELEEVIELNI